MPKYKIKAKIEFDYEVEIEAANEDEALKLLNQPIEADKLVGKMVNYRPGSIQIMEEPRVLCLFAAVNISRTIQVPTYDLWVGAKPGTQKFPAGESSLRLLLVALYRAGCFGQALSEQPNWAVSGVLYLRGWFRLTVSTEASDQCQPDWLVFMNTSSEYYAVYRDINHAINRTPPLETVGICSKWRKLLGISGTPSKFRIKIEPIPQIFWDELRQAKTPAIAQGQKAKPVPVMLDDDDDDDDDLPPRPVRAKTHREDDEWEEEDMPPPKPRPKPSPGAGS